MTAIFISHSSADAQAAARMKAWLGEQGHTCVFLDFDPDAGIRAGSDWEQTLYRNLRQCQAVIALVSHDWLASRWCFAELVQVRASGKAVFPVKVEPCDARSVFGDIQHIDLTVEPDDGYRRLAIGLKERGLDPRDVFAWDPARPIYPGLEAFKEEDAAIFFGRGEEILEGLETLDALRRQGRGAPRLALFLGASGSGKSSLVRAGVIPRLKKSSERWLTVAPFRPGEDPLDELARSLADAFAEFGHPQAWRDLRAQLMEMAQRSPVDGRALVSLVRDLVTVAGQRDATVVLTIDQAEELFGYSSPESAERFLRLLRAALEVADRQLMVIATMRSDSLGEFQTHASLHDSAYEQDLAYRAITIDPMPERRIADIIRGPAGLAGLEIDDGLVETMVRDTGTRDALPLLAFTLRRLHEGHAMPEGRLRLRDYESMGGLAGAVRLEAERVLAECAPSAVELEALRAAFVPTMVRINAEGGFTRRRAHLEDTPVESRRLLARLVDARLVVSGQDGDKGETIEVAHEALLRTWPQLIGWLSEDRDRLHLLAGIQRAAHEWAQSDEPEDLLVHRDGRLQDALTLTANPRFALPERAVGAHYLRACAAAQHEREAAARAEQERRLLDAERLAAARKRTLRWVGAAGVVALALAVLAGWQYRSATENEYEAKRQQGIAESNAKLAADRETEATAAREEAEMQARRALAQRDAALRAESRRDALLAGEAIARGEHAKALSLALRAVTVPTSFTNETLTERPYTAEGAEALVRAMRPFRHLEHIINGAADALVAFVDDDRSVLSVSRDNTWALRSATTGELIRHFDAVDAGLTPSAWAVALAPESGHFITGHTDGTAYLWSIEQPAPLHQFRHGHRGDRVMSVDIATDASTVATGTYQGRWALWVRADRWSDDPDFSGTHGRPENGNTTVALLLSQGDRLVTVSNARGSVLLWKLTPGVPARHLDPIPISHRRSSGVGVLRDSGKLVITEDHKPAQLIDADTGAVRPDPAGDVRFLGTPRMPPLPVKSVELKSVRKKLRRFSTGESVERPRGSYASALSPDGRLLVATESRDRVTVWNLPSGELHLAMHGSPETVSFSLDGRSLALGSKKRLTIWDVSEPLSRSVEAWSSGDYRVERWDAAPADCGRMIVDAVCHADGVVFLTAHGDRYDERAVCVQDTRARTIYKLPLVIPAGGVVMNGWELGLVGDGSLAYAIVWNRDRTMVNVRTGKVLDPSSVLPHGPGPPVDFTDDPSRSYDQGFMRTTIDGTAATRFDGPGGERVGLVGSAHIKTLAISPGRDLIVSAGKGPVRVWEAGSGRLVDILGDGDPGDDDRKRLCASFDATGEHVFTATEDGEFRTWPVRRFRSYATLLEAGSKISGNMAKR